jgi:uncharacterized protein
VGLPELLATPARQTATLAEVAHRPWEVPSRPWLMAQTWDDLLFAHWPLRPAELESFVPRELPLDTYEGDAWLGMTPFALLGLRLIGTPPLPRLSSFLELNVRTYVTLDGKPGIFFFSLDAASSVAVAGARRLYRLPYFRAAMSCDRNGGRLRYESRRLGGGHEARFAAFYAGSGAPEPARPGSLEHFVAERYCLYTVSGGRVFRGQIHHPPWPLEAAEAEIERNTMPPPGVRLPAGPPLLHYSARQDVLIWPLEHVR